MSSYVLEIYRGAAPDAAGEEMTAEQYGQLDAETLAWLDANGYGGNDPDVWVNVVAVGTWAPNNHPIAERSVTL